MLAADILAASCTVGRVLTIREREKERGKERIGTSVYNRIIVVDDDDNIGNNSSYNDP